MLKSNLNALRLAYALMTKQDGIGRYTRGELQDASSKIGELIAKVAETLERFRIGTAQHSLQRNRLKALQVAQSIVLLQLKRAK